MTTNYTITLVTRDGRSIPMPHLVYESRGDARLAARKIVTENNYRDFEINEANAGMVPGRDFQLVDGSKVGDYVLGYFEHPDEHTIKLQAYIFKYNGEHSFDWKGKTYTQPSYEPVEPVKGKPAREVYKKQVQALVGGAPAPVHQESKKPAKKPIKEDIGVEAIGMEKDHEVQMVRSQLYHIASDAIRLHKLLRTIPADTDLENWITNKITLATDYIQSIADYMEHQIIGPDSLEPIYDTDMDMPSLDIQVESALNEMTAGGVATVAMPMGSIQKRKKKVKEEEADAVTKDKKKVAKK